MVVSCRVKMRRKALDTPPCVSPTSAAIWRWLQRKVVQADQVRGELVAPLFHCQVGRIARGGLRFELDDRRGRRPATRRHLALPARGHVRLTARVPVGGELLISPAIR